MNESQVDPQKLREVSRAIQQMSVVFSDNAFPQAALDAAVEALILSVLAPNDKG